MIPGLMSTHSRRPVDSSHNGLSPMSAPASVITSTCSRRVIDVLLVRYGRSPTVHAAVAATGHRKVGALVRKVGGALLVEANAVAGSFVDVQHALLEPVADIEHRCGLVRVVHVLLEPEVVHRR